MENGKQTLRERIVEFLNARRKAIAAPIATGISWAALHLGLEVDPELAASVSVIVAGVAVNYIDNVVRGLKAPVLDRRV